MVKISLIMRTPAGYIYLTVGIVTPGSYVSIATLSSYLKKTITNSKQETD